MLHRIPFRLFILLSLLMALWAVPASATASPLPALSPGCVWFDGQSGTLEPGWLLGVERAFLTGETLSVSFELGTGTTLGEVSVEVNYSQVGGGTQYAPVTITYTFPSDGLYVLYWENRSGSNGPVNYTIHCSAPPDADGDGIPDASDVCPNYDDNTDADSDGIPDGCDTFDNNDTDGDGVSNADDVCPDSDDQLDNDRDGIPNSCDITPFPPGPDMIAIPDTAVVGTFTTATALYSQPHPAAATPYLMAAGQSLWVFSLSTDGAYYQVVLSGQKLWVPVGTIGPTDSAPWYGKPLPR